MIVKNEEGTLGHCLASVQTLVDEIVIVDTGSTDGTLAIARQYGARIFQHPWRDDFSAARNESLRHCSGDWLLVLDADEDLDALDFPVIREALAQDRIPAFQLILRNYFTSGAYTNLGEAASVNTSHYREGATFPHYADGRGLRLCRNLPDLAFRGRIHELLTQYFQDQGLPIQDLPVVVHHYGKVFQDREAGKLGPYLELARLDAQERPEDYQTQFNLLHPALAAGAWECALKAAQACLRLHRKARDPLALLGAGIALQHLGKPAEGLEYLDILLKDQPGHAFASVRRALSLAMLNRQDEARAALQRAREAKPDFLLPYLNLGEYELQWGRPREAQKAAQQGLRVLPDEPGLLNLLIQSSVQAGDVPLAVDTARRALQAHPALGEGRWHQLVGVSLLQEGQIEQGRQVVENGMKLFPGDAGLRRIWSMIH